MEERDPIPEDLKNIQVSKQDDEMNTTFANFKYDSLPAETKEIWEKVIHVPQE